jgi:hypothetical protein
MPSSEVLSKFKRGSLHSGSKSGKKVTSRKQAIAIMLSEKRKESSHGGVYPKKAADALEGNTQAKGKGKFGKFSIRKE